MEVLVVKSGAERQRVSRALFEISRLREEVHALRHGMASAAASRLLLRLALLEVAAILLLDDGQPVTAADPLWNC
jgi:hypothetical protein